MDKSQQVEKKKRKRSADTESSSKRTGETKHGSAVDGKAAAITVANAWKSALDLEKLEDNEDTEIVLLRYPKSFNPRALDGVKVSDLSASQRISIGDDWTLAPVVDEHNSVHVLLSSAAAAPEEGEAIPLGLVRNTPVRMLQLSRATIPLPSAFGPVLLQPSERSKATVPQPLRYFPGGFGSVGPVAAAAPTAAATIRRASEGVHEAGDDADRDAEERAAKKQHKSEKKKKREQERRLSMSSAT